ncbi:FAD-dependent oxidoreductase [Raoultibacter massiliensis]|uniref:FAD-dependent oxidoreductase n=1 Tax=Raoultibacter massiliensis TaxID=1852371 RepID=UPI000C82A6DD|nr:FAD-dependent oxidoreductase [Raoultibacter massiliensis]
MKTIANVSRRDFLKGGAVIAAGSATMGLIGCVPGDQPTATDAGGSAVGKHTWETKPDPIQEIASTVEADVVIVGGGYSGCACALSCAENGLKTILVEKGGDVHGNGIGGTGAVSSKAMKELGVEVDVAEEFQRWMGVCGGRARYSLVAKYIRESERTMDWLLDLAEKHGAQCMVTVGCEGKVWREASNYHWLFGGDLYEEYGAAVFVEKIFQTEAEALGVQFIFDSPAVQLVQDDRGGVTGVVCETKDGYVQYGATKGVVLATGDVSYNDEYMEEFLPIVNRAKHIQTITTNTGDGHNMAAWAGAALQEGPWASCLDFQGGAMFRGPFMLVTEDGKRCVNESLWAHYVCVGVLNHGSTEAWSVFDKNWTTDLVDSLQYGGGGFWDTFRAVGSDPSLAATDNEATVEDGLANDPDNYKRADTLEELADMMGVDREAFLAEVDRYNKFCDEGWDSDFCKEPGLLYPIVEPPFTALRCVPAMLTTMSGIHISDNFEALDAEDNIIPGLYAIGNCSGDMYAIDYPINLQGNAHGHCLMMGKCMGEFLAGNSKDSVE